MELLIQPVTVCRYTCATDTLPVGISALRGRESRMLEGSFSKAEELKLPPARGSLGGKRGFWLKQRVKGSLQAVNLLSCGCRYLILVNARL